MNPRKHCPLVIQILSMALVMSFPCTALAERTGKITVTVDGKVYLYGQYSEKGSSPPAAVWSYSSTTPLQPKEGVTIKPDADDPLRATLRGKIVLEVEHGDKAEIEELHLVRPNAESVTWTVDPRDVEKLSVKLGLSGEPVGPIESRPAPSGQVAKANAADSFPWGWLAGGVAVGIVLVAIGFVLARRRPKSR